MEIIKYTQLEKYNGASTQEEKDAIEINPYKIIYGAMENAKPLLKIADMRKGAVMYRVPVPGENLKLWELRVCFLCHPYEASLVHSLQAHFL